MTAARPNSVDVLVLGGGPAGCAAAIRLSQQGLAVLLVERSRDTEPRTGEMLPPEGGPWLQRLGVWEAFCRDCHPTSPGIVAAWDSSCPYEKDFIFNPLGSGWQLDRRRFDRMFSKAATAAGARVVSGARLRDCARNHQPGWLATIAHSGRELSIRSAFVIDATGRRAWFARRQHSTRVASDNLVGVIGYCARADAQDRRMFLEAVSDGWWYAARLRGNQTIAVYLTDADLLPRGKTALQSFWGDQLKQTSVISRFLGKKPCRPPLRTVSAHTARLDVAGGTDWLAIGDAALSCDPLSGRGIVGALESAIRASDELLELLRRPSGTPSGYLNWIDASFRGILRGRAHYYRQVTRWPGSRFWSRRQPPSDETVTTAVAGRASTVQAPPMSWPRR